MCRSGKVVNTCKQLYFVVHAAPTSANSYSEDRHDAQPRLCRGARQLRRSALRSALPWPRAGAGLAAAPGHDRGAVQRRRHHRHVRPHPRAGPGSRNTATPFVVDNRAGAGGNIGAAAVARAPKDGYTLLVGTVSTHAINPFIYKNLAHDTEKDFQPISLIARLPNMLVVNPKIPAKTVAELVEHLKKNDGQAELRLVRRRHLDASRVRAVPAQDRHQDDARALSQLRRRDECADRRPHRSRLRQHHAGLAARQGRHIARARGHQHAARARRRRRCRRSPPPCPASRRPPGTACSRPPARRARSSISSPPR